MNRPPPTERYPKPRRSAYLPRVRLDRWRPGDGQTIAAFDVTIGAHVLVPDCRLMEAANGGRFLSLPRRLVDDDWTDVILVSPALREAIRRAAQDAAHAAVAPIPEAER